jgi:hypothetical protein
MTAQPVRFIGRCWTGQISPPPYAMADRTASGPSEHKHTGGPTGSDHFLASRHPYGSVLGLWPVPEPGLIGRRSGACEQFQLLASADLGQSSWDSGHAV